MALLIVGLIVFLGTHSVRIVAPAWRDHALARLGEGPYKGLFSLVSIAGFALIIVGFGRAASDTGLLYLPPFGLRRLTEALMLPALILAVASLFPQGYIKHAVRNPLLIGTALWAFAHLIVNGETAAVVLFGAFLAWSIVDLATQRGRTAPAAAKPSAVYDALAVVSGVALYGLLIWRLHAWAFGVAPTM